MASTSETGHAKNVANFNNLIAFVTQYGPTYNPTKNSLKLPALDNLAKAAREALDTVTTKNTSYNNAINERSQAFSGLRALGTKLVSALEVTDASPEKIKDAVGFNRKLQGRRASTSAQTATHPNAPAPSTISVSQQSYDQQIQHFAGLSSVLSSESSYNPNEQELQTNALEAKKELLLEQNNRVAVAYAEISNSRIDRNKTLYNFETGLLDTATEVKKYVKSVFGASSPEYAQVRAIEFKAP